MTTLIDCPGSGFGEWRFRLFDVPVRVSIWFWIVILIVGGEQGPGLMLCWLSTCFLSILWHELGHVLAFRFFRERAEVVLYGWGGLTIPRRGVYGSLPNLVVALAGPFAGFFLAGVAVLAALWSGAVIQLNFHMFVPVLAALPPAPTRSLWYVLLNDMLWVNLYWGLINLLPVLPLDGGHASQAIFDQADPQNGMRKALILSAVVAGAVALYAILEMNYYLAIMFVVLAVSSLQMLDGAGAQRRAYRSPRY